MTYIDWIGSVGVALILLAFFLNINGKIKHTDQLYIVMNFTGAVMACVASILLKYVPFIILEGIWAIVSLKSLYHSLKKSNI